MTHTKFKEGLFNVDLKSRQKSFQPQEKRDARNLSVSFDRHNIFFLGWENKTGKVSSKIRHCFCLYGANESFKIGKHNSYRTFCKLQMSGKKHFLYKLSKGGGKSYITSCCPANWVPSQKMTCSSFPKL